MAITATGMTFAANTELNTSQKVHDLMYLIT